ncbi:hypothetical protein [Natrinema altunense]|uniref:DUF7974 domain-containing protein n=2 Tax=Natrinema altunense TaxID=222984 RepID=L9ZYK8_NATA2|nr:hypothetical protein [Natrinema altunense]ELY91166.1 hypothetical protein C485_02154 [Natrinema altunense JCM 12890]RZH66438.1 hypothetical protein ELS17_17315 [Natrinema altunense]
MRRIYDSRALERTNDDPFAPDEDEARDGPRTIDWAAFSHAFMPTALRHRALAVSVSTDARRYESGDPVDITITFRNRLPFPIRLRTESPNRWLWTVDGLRAASKLPPAVPDRPAAFAFTRGERKTFRRQWPQRIQVADDEWEPVDPGTYTIAVRIARADAADRGLVDSTTIEITD